MKSIKSDEKVQSAAAATPETEPTALYSVGKLFTPIELNNEVTIEQVTHAMQGFNESRLRQMLALIHLLEHHGGDSTPAENMISTLLLLYGLSGGCVTLEDVENQMEGFRDNWRMMVSEVTGAAQRYPHLFSVVGAGEAAAEAGADAPAQVEELADSTAAKEDAPKPQATDTEASTDEQPESPALHMALQALDESISSIKSQREMMPDMQKKSPTQFAEDLADAVLLRDVLEGWYCGSYDSQFPTDSSLTANFKGNISR